MTAISLWQPWASAMMPPVCLKTIETRSRPTKVRGLVAIHAAKKQSKELAAFFDANNEDKVMGGIKPFDLITGSFYDLPFGCVLGYGELIDCVQMNQLNLKTHPDLAVMLNSNEQAWGNYDLGRFAWIFRNLVRFDEPIPAKGMQGFFNVEVTP